MAETVGQVLRAAREATGRSVVELARITRIPVGSLVALEENNFEALPASVFVRGFVRSYAREVRLDPPDVLALYDAHLNETTLRAPTSDDEPVLAPLLYVSGSAEVQRDSFRGLQVSHVLLLALAAITMVIAYVTAGVSDDKSAAGRDDGRPASTAGRADAPASPGAASRSVAGLRPTLAPDARPAAGVEPSGRPRDPARGANPYTASTGRVPSAPR